MKKNYLYGAVGYLEKQNEAGYLGGVGEVTLAKYKNEKNYYRLEFNQEVNTSSFKLEDAHMSIFEHFDPQNSKLSAAHFTAHLNKGNSRYRLHLFLNENGYHVCQPCWEVYKDSSYIGEAITDEVNTVIAETLNAGMPVFRQLRNKQTDLVATLTQEYEQLDKADSEFEKKYDVLKLNGGDDQQEYLALIYRKIKTVTRLSEITMNHRWPQLLSYYQALSNNLKNGTFTNNVLEESTIENKEQDFKKTEGKGKEKETEEAATNYEITHQPLKKPTLSPFQKLQKLFHQFEKEPKNTDLLVKLMYQLQEIDQTKLSLTQLKTFQSNQKQIFDSGISCYDRALLAGNFDLARQLYQFSDERLYKLMGYALATKKIDLVKFLINDLDFPIEVYPIKLKSEEYANVLEYCYKHSQDERVVELFDIFLSKDYFSICRSINGSLPIAHRILTENPKSPLLEVLEKKPHQTIDNRCFYQLLINSCQLCIDQMPQHSEEREEIETQVGMYATKQQQVSYEKGIFNETSLLEKNKLVTIAKENLPDDVTRQILTDEDLVSRSNQLTKRAKKLMLDYKRFQQRSKGKTIAFNQFFQQEFVLSQKLLKEMSFENLDFLQVKAVVLGYFNKSDKLLANCEKLLTVQKQLIGTQSVARKKNKRHKNLINQEKELLALVQKQSDQLLPSRQFQDNNEVFINLSNMLQELKTSLANLNEWSFFPPDQSNHVLSGFASSSSCQANEDSDIDSDSEDYIKPIDFELF